jgi:uncharacterized protein (TIRG00374 family)
MSDKAARIVNKNKRQRLWLHILVWLLVLGLVAWAMLQVPLAETWQALRGLTLIQIALILGVNVLLILAFSARWWILLDTMGHRVPYVLLSLHRLAGFSVSYFTPGPQVGGEPLQVLLLRKHHQIPLVTATTSIGVDRLIEIAINLSILMAGVIIALQSQLLGGLTNPALVILFSGLTLLPLIYIVQLIGGRQPLSWLLNRLPAGARQQAFFQKMLAATQESEQQATTVFREKPASVLAAVGVSLLSWLAIIGEYWLVLHFIGLALTPTQLIILLLVTRVAFLAPLPSGLGVLEASQVLAFEALGFEPAVGLTASLLIRGRDILFGLIGLWWAGLEWTKYER